MAEKRTAPETPKRPGRAEIAAEVRLLVRQALKGALATLEPAGGGPYVSLVTVATEPDGTPLMLLSRLALHTKNIMSDHRASLLIDASGGDADPLSGGRVSLIGRVAPTSSPTAAARFLARHPGAEGYAQFSDFAFYALQIERAHYVGGFGRIVDLATADLIVATERAVGDSEILRRLDAKLRNEVAGFVTNHAKSAQPSGEWRIAGIDNEGVDLVGPGAALRLTRGEHHHDLERELRNLLVNAAGAANP